MKFGDINTEAKIKANIESPLIEVKLSDVPLKLIFWKKVNEIR